MRPRERREIARTAHARQRAQERYGVTLSGSDLMDLRSLIASGRAVALATADLDRQHWLVSLRGKAFKVVYSASADRILTVLSPSHRLPRR